MLEKMLFFILLAISATLLFSAVSTTVLAAQNTTIMDVNVSELSQITLSPTYLNWVLVVAGTQGGSKNITISNTGSVNVSQIYSYVDTLTDETTKPYGTSDSTKYAAGGVITIRNETDTKYYYLGKLEWNWTDDIPTHNWGDVNNPVSWGFFKNLTNSYVWLVGNGTGGLCNETGSQFAIEDDIDTGVLATRTPTVLNVQRDSQDANYAYFSILRSTAPIFQYCVAVSTDCQKIYIYHFDRRSGFSTCSASTYLSYGNLTSGYPVTVKVDPWIPWGTPSGNLSQATLTVVAS